MDHDAEREVIRRAYAKQIMAACFSTPYAGSAASDLRGPTRRGLSATGAMSRTCCKSE